MPSKKKKKADESNAASGRIARNRMRIAWMYYVEGLTQGEIADSLGIGRVNRHGQTKIALDERRPNKFPNF